MSEHTNSRDRVVSEAGDVPEDGHPTAADTRLDQLLAAADDDLSKCLNDALDLTGGIRKLASLAAFPGPSWQSDRPCAPEPKSLQHAERPGAETPDVNGQLQQALDLLQHISELFHGLLRMTDDGPSSLETARSNLTRAQMAIGHLVVEAQSRTLTRTLNTTTCNGIHDRINTAWTTVAQTLQSPSADYQAVILVDALETLDCATRRLTQAHHILDHLLTQIGEDVVQPLPA